MYKTRSTSCVTPRKIDRSKFNRRSFKVDYHLLVRKRNEKSIFPRQVGNLRKSPDGRYEHIPRGRVTRRAVRGKNRRFGLRVPIRNRSCISLSAASDDGGLIILFIIIIVGGTHAYDDNHNCRNLDSRASRECITRKNIVTVITKISSCLRSRP